MTTTCPCTGLSIPEVARDNRWPSLTGRLVPVEIDGTLLLRDPSGRTFATPADMIRIANNRCPLCGGLGYLVDGQADEAARMAHRHTLE